MNFKEFQKECLVTFKVGTREMNLAHCVIGVVSELNELEEAFQEADVVNISEEMCDILYYLAVYCHYRDIPVDTITEDLLYFNGFTGDSSKHYKMSYLHTDVSKWADVAKKHIFYEKDTYDEDVYHLESIAMNTAVLAGRQGINLSDGMDKLINKLRVRYGTEFSAEKANNRDIETERRVLEGK